MARIKAKYNQDYQILQEVEFILVYDYMSAIILSAMLVIEYRYSEQFTYLLWR